jgi:hypothetical protein
LSNGAGLSNDSVELSSLSMDEIEKRRYPLQFAMRKPTRKQARIPKDFSCEFIKHDLIVV